METGVAGKSETHSAQNQPAANEDIENVRTEYKEVCQNHRAVADFRGKLLTLIPLASGAGIFLLIKPENPDKVRPEYLLAIGIFGCLVTLGLFLHELRGIAECGDLIEVGRRLEEKMGLADGQFIREYNYYHPEDDHPEDRPQDDHPRDRRPTKFLHQLKGPVGAAWVIYLSVGAAWLAVAVFGVVRLLG